MEKATFAAGCFWHVEEEFRKIKGVIDAKAGYTGGNIPEPRYEIVCTDKTGHAEAVDIIFDPKIISYEQLLEVFWSIHDPTQLNMQGADIGTQYRSAIFYRDEKQKKSAEKSKREKQKNHDKKIMTEVVSAKEFYKSEEYPQRYIEKKKDNPVYNMMNW